MCWCDFGSVWIPWQNFSSALLAFFFCHGDPNMWAKEGKWAKHLLFPFAPLEVINWAKSATLSFSLLSFSPFSTF
jgi:hypothetical protein